MTNIVLNCVVANLAEHYLKLSDLTRFGRIPLSVLHAPPLWPTLVPYFSWVSTDPPPNQMYVPRSSLEAHLKLEVLDHRTLERLQRALVCVNSFESYALLRLDRASLLGIDLSNRKVVSDYRKLSPEIVYSVALPVASFQHPAFRRNQEVPTGYEDARVFLFHVRDERGRHIPQAQLRQAYDQFVNDGELALQPLIIDDRPYFSSGDIEKIQKRYGLASTTRCADVGFVGYTQLGIEQSFSVSSRRIFGV